MKSLSHLTLFPSTAAPAARDAHRTAGARAALLGALLSCTLAAWALDLTTAVWTKIASEGQTFSVSGTQTVRYGTGSSWVLKTMSGTGSCSNSFFGSDPMPGTVKECQLASAPATTTWTTIAAEGQSFTVSGTQTVRYGANSSWLTKSVTTSGQCTSSFFGGDPLYGTLKQCQVASTTTTTAPSVAAVCSAPVAAANTAGVSASVGTGTPQSCTEGALRNAVNAHSIVTFNCGSTPVTIPITQTIELPTDRNIVIDGGNKVTLDGGGRTRILRMVRPNYRTNTYGLTLQHITLANGHATSATYVPPSTTNPSCAYGYSTDGGGGALLVRDATLRVIDATFRNNTAATPGPDVGGGAIYAMGSLDVTIVGSTFTGNSAANGGAVGLLQTNGRFYNSVFTSNAANGTGGNYQGGAANGCPGVAQANQGGAGGNGGVISIDGADDTDVMVCGSRFVGNQANEFAGSLFRTSNGAARHTTIDRSLFQSNRGKQGGALFIMNSKPLDILASTFASNVAQGGGAGKLSYTRINMVNSTFAGNEATHGLGGALYMGGTDSTSLMRNATFSANKSSAGSGYYSAALGGVINFPIYNSVFANNITADAWSPMQCGSAPTSGAYNLQWPRAHVVGGALDTLCVNGIAFADPLLGALANNGGPTPTVAPASTSPLRGAGRNCPSTDQRGVARNTTQCTAGAVE